MITYLKGAITLASNSELPIESYDPPDISFHSTSHLQRWENSPLSNQDPHLWTAFLLTFVACSVFFGFKYIQKRRQVAEDKKGSSRLEEIGKDLMIKQKYLEAKIIELEKSYGIGNVSKGDYQQFHKQYIEKLDRIKLQMQEIEDVIDKGISP